MISTPMDKTAENGAVSPSPATSSIPVPPAFAMGTGGFREQYLTRDHGLCIQFRISATDRTLEVFAVVVDAAQCKARMLSRSELRNEMERKVHQDPSLSGYSVTYDTMNAWSSPTRSGALFRDIRFR